MKKIGIIQPGRLGDLIICLPIAKHYVDLGYEVMWPVMINYYKMLTETVDYVKFIPVSNDVYKCVYDAYNVLNGHCEMYDLAATFPGSLVTEEYVSLGDGFGSEKFDEFKYRKANVPFEKKWDLVYKRNSEMEDKVYNDVVMQHNYDVVNLKHSGGRINVKIESKNQVVEMNEKYNLFYWRKVLENAQCIAMVDSAPANLVEQLNIQCKKILFTKPKQPTPTFKNAWKTKQL